MSALYPVQNSKLNNYLSHLYLPVETHYFEDFINSNEDKLFFIRIYADEYEVGLGPAKKHFQSLADALNMSLSEIGFSTNCENFGEWLRQRDYNGINYDRNIDLQ